MNTTLETPKSAATNSHRLFTTPRANILGNGEITTIQLDLPGVNRAGLEVTVEEQTLVIVGNRNGQVPGGNRLHTEISPVSYRRVFELTPTIDAERITADLRDGVLTLTLPTAEKAKPRQITIS